MSSCQQIFLCGVIYALFFCGHACPCRGIYQFFRHLAVSWEGDVMGTHAQAEIASPTA